MEHPKGFEFSNSRLLYKVGRQARSIWSWVTVHGGERGAPTKMRGWCDLVGYCALPGKWRAKPNKEGPAGKPIDSLWV